MYRVVVAALLVAALVAWPTGVGAQDVTVDATDVPIVWVDLEAAGGFVSQSGPASSVVDHSSSPVRLSSITVDHGGLRSLSPITVGVTAANIALSGDGTGFGASGNGALVGTSANDFPAAAGRALAAADLRQYLRGSDAADGGRLSAELTFAPPLAANAYLVVAHSDPAAAFRLSAAPTAGAGAPTAVVGAGVGWDTGFAAADQPAGHGTHLAVVAVSSLLDGTGASTLAALRVDGDAGADFKVVPAAAAGLTTIETDPAVLTVEPTPIPGDALGFVTAVYPGTDGGAGCEQAANTIQTLPQTTVTYCYTVTNNGTEALSQVTVSDPDVAGAMRSIGDEVAELGPGQSARFFLEGTPPPDDADGVVDDVHVSVATVAAVGVDTGHDYATTAEAIVFAPNDAADPAIAIALTAYSGHDGGAGCPGGDRTVVASGDPLTYCYVVTNNGNTFVHGIHVDHTGSEAHPALLGGELTEMLPLAPGASATFFLEAAAPATPAAGTLASARVVANPVDEFCGDLAGLPDVVADDGTELTSSPVTPPDPEQNGGTPPSPVDPPTGNATPTPGQPTGGTPPGQTTTPEGSQTGGGAPDELAYTGWETWILITTGIALVAGGLAVSIEAGRSRRAVPVPVAGPADRGVLGPRS
ncbi:MAG: hypothetical protein AAFN30_00900 [Actinomycetota bacterium]